MPGRPAVSVVIPARDAAATLGRTLAALAVQDIDAPFETIVVDNGSLDGSGEVAEQAELPVRVIRLERGGDAGLARNAGAAAAAADAIAFTDADCFPAPGWLREGLTALAGLDIVQGRVEPDPETPLSSFAHSVWVTRPSPLYETANLLIRKELFERLGGFDERAALDGRPFGEDVELGWRARRAGAGIGFAERALVRHAVVPRAAHEYIADQRRLGWFPPLVRTIPELRRELLHSGLFLTPRRARFGLAMVGVAAARATRSRLPLTLALPYLREIGAIALANGRRAPYVGTVEIAADMVGAVALVTASVRSRAPVL